MDKYKNKLLEFKQILQKGENLGVPLENEIQKVDDILASAGTPIKIVLAGSFSDGKTSVIAGLLGKVTPEMDISQDESTNELRYYQLSDGVNRYDIVDTPGLFGNKSEVNGNGDIVKYSDKTKDYISRADILLYVCEATNPLKDSHKKNLYHILRDFNKLSSAIFVINKMDEVSELTDEEDYEANTRIKSDTFRQRLNDVLHLTDEESSKLRIVCISANPFGRGMKEWLSVHSDTYDKYSHINNLKRTVADVLAVADNAETRQNTFKAALKDLVIALVKEILRQYSEIYNPQARFKHDLDELQKQADDTRAKLLENRKRMSQELKEKHNQLIKNINSAPELQDLDDIIETEIGKDGEGNIDANMLFCDINNSMSKYVESNNKEISSKSDLFIKIFESQDNFLKEQATKGIKYIGSVTISGEQIKQLRDIFAKDHKFGPWGAVNLGKKVTKYFKIAGKALDKLQKGYEIYKKWHETKLTEETRNSLKNFINQIFSDLNKGFLCDEAYFKEYAPGYLELQKSLDERKEKLYDMESHCNDLKSYKQTVTNWYGEDVTIDEA